MTNEYDTAPGPLAMFRKIPQWLRWWIYSIALTVFAVEGVLDISDAGLIPAKTQTIVWGLAGVFGMVQAVANTERKTS